MHPAVAALGFTNGRGKWGRCYFLGGGGGAENEEGYFGAMVEVRNMT